MFYHDSWLGSIQTAVTTTTSSQYMMEKQIIAPTSILLSNSNDGTYLESGENFPILLEVLLISATQESTLVPRKFSKEIVKGKIICDCLLVYNTGQVSAGK